jgi:hypothetical protein
MAATAKIRCKRTGVEWDIPTGTVAYERCIGHPEDYDAVVESEVKKGRQKVD